MIKLRDQLPKGFELGKVYSNPFSRSFKSLKEEELPGEEYSKIKEEDSEDHEVSMAQNQLDSIIKHATELKKKMGEEEKQIPAWIQDHITNSENYISQANSNYHEYGDSNEGINEAKKYDIGSGYMGNGLTIWNRAEEEHGDYKIIAHISPQGKLSIRDKQLPSDLKKMFQIWADSMAKGKMGPKY